MSYLSTLLLLITTIATFHSPQTAFNLPNAPWRPLPPPPSETTKLLSAASDNAPAISNHHIRRLAHVVYALPHPATIKQHRRSIATTAGPQFTTAPSILDGFASFQPSSPHRRVDSGHSPQSHCNPSISAAATKRSLFSRPPWFSPLSSYIVPGTPYIFTTFSLSFLAGRSTHQPIIRSTNHWPSYKQCGLILSPIIISTNEDDAPTNYLPTLRDLIHRHTIPSTYSPGRFTHLPAISINHHR
jgi:hypothetical protein